MSFPRIRNCPFACRRRAPSAPCFAIRLRAVKPYRVQRRHVALVEPCVARVCAWVDFARAAYPLIVLWEEIVFQGCVCFTRERISPTTLDQTIEPMVSRTLRY